MQKIISALRYILFHTKVIIAIGVLAFVGYFGSTWTWYRYVEPRLLQQSYEQLKFPAEFTQTSTTYRQGSIDVAPAWVYQYRLTGTRQNVYNDVATMLKQAGFEDVTSVGSPEDGARSGYITVRNAKRHMYITVSLYTPHKDNTTSDGSSSNVRLDEPLESAQIEVER